MKIYLKLFVLLLFFPLSAFCASLQVTWNANTEPDLAKYKVYWAAPGDPGWSIANDIATYTLGTFPHTQEVLKPATTLLIPTVPGPYAVLVSAIDASGNESAKSAPAVALVPTAPVVIVVPPINLPPNAPLQVIINLVQ